MSNMGKGRDGSEEAVRGVGLLGFEPRQESTFLGGRDDQPSNESSAWDRDPDEG